MGFLPLLGKWVCQGVVTYGAGVLPLFITSQSLLASLTTFGTGRLIASGLSTFLGSVFMGSASMLSIPFLDALGFSPVVVSIIHIAGVLFMLVAERRLSSRKLESNPDGLSPDTPPSQPGVTPEDMELRNRLHTEDTTARRLPTSRTAETFGPHQRRVYLFIFAFVFVEVTAGIGAGLVESSSPIRGASDSSRPPLSERVMAFNLLGLIGKVATTLGFATTLLAASLPITECKRYVLLYTATAPLTSLLAYGVTILARITPNFNGFFTIALHTFADGMFVYAALIVRSLISSSRMTARNSLRAKVLLLAAGAFLPYMLPMVVTIVLFLRLEALRLGKVDTKGV